MAVLRLAWRWFSLCMPKCTNMSQKHPGNELASQKRPCGVRQTSVDTVLDFPTYSKESAIFVGVSWKRWRRLNWMIRCKPWFSTGLSPTIAEANEQHKKQKMNANKKKIAEVTERPDETFEPPQLLRDRETLFSI